MSEPKKRRATYQDVLDAPEHEIAEIINGEFVLSPRPAGPATGVGSSLFGELFLPFDRGRGGPGGWVILFEPEVHFEDDVLVPDIAAWRVERMPVLPEGMFTVMPDWVCEMLSKSTERRDRMEKMAIYASMGVGHVWLVHPIKRTLEAYRREGTRWVTVGLHQHDARARIEPFDAIELDLSLLWRGLPLPTRASEQSGECAYDL